VKRNHLHLHLISDATGETLIAISRAAAAQYQDVSSIEHIYPLIRTEAQLERAISEIRAAPGIVLYTLVDPEHSRRLEDACRDCGSPSLSVLGPILNLFQSYIGKATTPRPGAQHTLNADYFRRIDALNFTLVHDDGANVDNYEEADVLLVGISRTSKTPTSIYLANRGVKTANIPMVPSVALPPSILTLKNPLIVGLLATPDRIIQIRQNRLLSLKADGRSDYIDRGMVTEEVATSRRFFERQGWPIIDVTRRSIEETAAAIIDLYRNRNNKAYQPE
jgi:[pyruvate, water dikinase]-phosphate phosphotransferase / [pyruvate, water dikinase] kinase